jgi:nitrogen regulatory protein P-II 1
MMYRIEASIQPHRLETVRRALADIGVDGMTVADVRGHGRQKGHKESYRGREYVVDLRPRILIELVAAGDRKDEIIRTLASAARSGSIGDGKIFLEPVLAAIRIRNDDRDETAL